MVLSVVIPVFNEIKTIREIFRRIKAIDLVQEIILVDDYSTDGTREILTELEAAGAKVLYHDKNKGKGAALRTGFNEVAGDVVIIQDADLEYDPTEYEKLLRPDQEGMADFTVRPFRSLRAPISI